MKCILRVDQKNVQSPSPCSPGQGIPLERGDISEGSLATLLWAQEHQEMTHLPIEKVSWRIRRNELKETEWQFFMDGTTGYKKQLMENTG